MAKILKPGFLSVGCACYPSSRPNVEEGCCGGVTTHVLWSLKSSYARWEPPRDPQQCQHFRLFFVRAHLRLLARPTSMSDAPLFSLEDFARATDRAMEARELARRGKL